jgi:hypothetical protein
MIAGLLEAIAAKNGKTHISRGGRLKTPNEDRPGKDKLDASPI